MHCQPASRIASCQLKAWRMSWLIVSLRTFSLNKRQRFNQSERSYHKVDADATTLVLIHTGCVLAEEEMDWGLMLFENPPFPLEMWLPPTLLGTSRSLKFQTANAINLLLTTAVRIRERTCRHQRDGEKRGERESAREERDRGGQSEGER